MIKTLRSVLIRAFPTCTLWRLNLYRDEVYLVVAPCVRITRLEFCNG